MSRCDALNERKSRREGRANFPGAHPGSAGILACLVLGNDLLTETSRQGCLRSQDICLDSFDAAYRENQANFQFALHISEEKWRRDK